MKKSMPDRTPDLRQKAVLVLREGYVCDHCLGRQFAQLLHGYGNQERGAAVRLWLACLLDAGAILDVAPANFSEVGLRRALRTGEAGPCSVCSDFFQTVDQWVLRCINALDGIEFNTFRVGTRLSTTLAQREEVLWARAGEEWSEPLKAEINRILGMALEERLTATADYRDPEMILTIDLERNRVKVETKPLFVYGRYQKLARGIPQTKWPSRKYRSSVEKVTSRPFIRAARAAGSAFHGMGREDVDVRCIAWRPFVLEIKSPRRRSLDLAGLEARINRSKRIKVKDLRFVARSVVAGIKQSRPDKTYRAVVRLGQTRQPHEFQTLGSLVGAIEQLTPRRVMHRRTDMPRRRQIKALQCKRLGLRRLELTITAEAGTYIKEFISGDEGRTRPSVAKVLGCDAVCRELDVIEIHTAFQPAGD